MADEFAVLSEIDAPRTKLSGNLGSLSRLSNFYHLDVSNTDVSGDLCDLPQDLVGLKAKGTGVRGDVRCLQNWRWISHISLADTATVGDVAAALSTNRWYLQSLDISRVKQIRGDLILLGDAKNLSTVQISGTQMSLHLNQSLSGKFPALKVLHARNIICSLTEHHIDFNENEAIFKSLHELDLAGSSLQGDAQRFFYSILCRAPLQRINVGNTKLSGEVYFGDIVDMRDANGGVVNHALAWASTLFSLDLSGTHVNTVHFNSRICVKFRSSCSTLYYDKPSLNGLGLRNTPNLSTLDDSLLLATSRVYVNLQGSGYQIPRDKALNIGLQASADVLTRQADYQCHAALGRPFLLLEPVTAAPESLCECLPGFYGRGKTCQRCSDQQYQNEPNGTKCKDCPFLERPRSDRTACEPNFLGHLLSFYGIVAWICVTWAFQLLRRAAIGVPIEDISMSSDGGLIVTTLWRHGIYCQGAHFRILSSGHPALHKAELEAHVMTGHRLKLIGFDSVESSMGYLRPRWPDGVFAHSVFKCPTAIVATILLVAAVCLCSPQAYGASAVLVIFLAGTFSLMVTMLFEHVRPAQSRLGLRTRAFQQLLNQSNPFPTACARGRGRGVSLAKLEKLVGGFQDLILDRNMYYVVANIVLPLTQHAKLSYAELVGPTEAGWFVSHYWGSWSLPRK